MINAQNIIDRFDALKTLRSGCESRWQRIARYVMPQRNKSSGEPALFDTTAVRANQTLANGQLAWMSPMESTWFDYSPKKGASDEAKLWLADVTATARNELATSNFYTAIHEFYLDRGAFAISAIYVEPGSDGGLNFKHLPCGTYVIDVNSKSIVDTLFREMKLDARQAAQEFGEENLSPKLRKALKDEKKKHEKVTFIHGIFPRADADKSKEGDKNMPWASVYIEVDTKHVARESGYEEQPFMVSRFLEWGSDETLGESCSSMYGWSPSFAAVADAAQLNHLERCGDALAEKIAFPPVLAPDELEGEIDPNPHGVTYFSRDMASANALPKEWMTQGRYDVAVQRAEVKREAINKAFFVDLFQMFAQIEKQMTAREVMERSQEKLIQFSPTFARLTGELFNPLLARVFGICLRAGILGDLKTIPADLMIRIDDESVNIPTPRITYSSQIALAMRAAPALGYTRAVERVIGLGEIAPDVADNYDFNKAERTMALNDGVPAEFMRKESDVRRMREERAAAMMEQQQMERQARAAESLGKVGGIKPDSVVGQAIEGMAA